MSLLKAIIFDLDGTLVDSARDLRDAVNILLVQEGLRQIDLGEVKSMIGDGAPKLVERAIAATGGDLSRLPTLVTRFLEIYEANASRHTEAYPGVADTLAGLRALGLPLGVVTNKPFGATIDILEALGLRTYFDAVIGGDTLPERKPHPAPILAALKQLGVAPEAALMIGDNYHDVQAARAAGVRTFAVTYGYSHKPHAELGADRLIDTMSELLPIVANTAAA
ncbi:phosphoglycolate phosphatase [Microvirga mediterraneensis]|uniref:Phosphoglycolate phosphatase n=1 Tax=Microvirga mediterraneensis TaxID=2754695 RepID=A0A838BLL8_9HYPH|nr:phosphoglycolate phosphatase [Microvirga mediterraneensis]MBA1155979.1 phosphoglycolate phosphatase [Microvirga mediterraneensis]